MFRASPGSLYPNYWRRAPAIALVIVSDSARRDATSALLLPRIPVGGLCRAQRLPNTERMLAERKPDGALVAEVARTAALEPPSHARSPVACPAPWSSRKRNA